jgi:ATP-binding cassette, subfamily B (MDR/TAP), member 1
MDIKPGQYVALVGASGCGKSTTVGLIERFYDPIAGEVLVDGVPVSEYNLADYRKNISIVSQEPTYPLDSNER